MPWQNHSWHAALYVSPCGYSTHGIPYEGRIFQIDFDFVRHELRIECTDEETVHMPLRSITVADLTVADFYKELFDCLNNLGIDIKIYPKPNEMDPAIPFAENTINKTYDQKAATAIWKAMLNTSNVFHTFRGEFIGKCSPVHLFWGAFDLAVTRFSGNEAPLHQGGMPNMPLDVMQEAYSHEVSSAGFWPGSKDFPYPAFYSYAYPANEAFGEQAVSPGEAFYSKEMGEFFLKYEDVIQSDNPEEMLLQFLRTTYEAAVNTSAWDREALEKQ